VFGGRPPTKPVERAGEQDGRGGEWKGMIHGTEGRERERENERAPDGAGRESRVLLISLPLCFLFFTRPFLRFCEPRPPGSEAADTERVEGTTKPRFVSALSSLCLVLSDPTQTQIHTTHTSPAIPGTSVGDLADTYSIPSNGEQDGEQNNHKLHAGA